MKDDNLHAGREDRSAPTGFEAGFQPRGRMIQSAQAGPREIGGLTRVCDRAPACIRAGSGGSCRRRRRRRLDPMTPRFPPPSPGGSTGQQCPRRPPPPKLRRSSPPPSPLRRPPLSFSSLSLPPSSLLCRSSTVGSRSPRDR